MVTSTDRPSDDARPGHPSTVERGQTAVSSPDRWLDNITLVVVVAFVLLGIGTPLLGLTVFAGSDIMLTRTPWNALAPTGFQAQNPFVGDTIDGMVPAARMLSERLHDGDFASWSSLNTGGSQLGAGGSSGLLSPLMLPYLVMPISLAPGYVKLLEMLVALGGMFLFLRQLSLARSAALLGGLAFVSSGFMVAWTNWPHTKVAAFVPALFWAIERLARDRRPANIAMIGLVVGSMLLSGFPAVAAYAFVAAGLYLIVRMATIHGSRPGRLVVVAGAATAGLLVGVAVAAMHLVPFADELREVAVGSRGQSSQSHSPMISMVTMLAPDALGITSPDASSVDWYGLANPIEELSYVGAVALLLVVIALVMRRRPGFPPLVRGFFVTAAAITVVLVFFGGPLLAALQQLPVFDTNRIGRARSMLGFFLAVLAAMGFDALVRRPAGTWLSTLQRRKWIVVASGVWLGAVIAAFLVVREAHQYAFVREQLVWFDGSLRSAATFGGLAAIAAALAVRGRGWLRATALTVIPALLVTQALLLVIPFWPRVPTSQFYPPTPTHEFLASHIGSDRIIAAGTMLTGTEAFYGLRTVGGRGFVAEEYDELLRAWCDGCFVTPTYMAIPGRPEVFQAPLLDRLGARYVVTDPAAPVLGAAEIVGGTGDLLTLSPEEPMSLPLPGGALRALGVEIAEPYATGDPWAAMEVEVKDADGTTLTTTRRRLFGGAAPGPFTVAVPEDDVASATSAVVTLHADLPIAIRSDGATPAIALVRPSDDDLEVVLGGATTIYERTSALPRIRWAKTAVVEPDATRAIDLVLSGTAPDVVLAAPGPEPSGAPATLDVVEDSGDTIAVDVDAEGLGYLVVADGLQDRWSAAIDGAAVPLVDADHGYVAVEVPPGTHRVELRYASPLPGGGFAISGGGLALIGALFMIDRRSRRRGTVRSSTTDPSGPVEPPG